MQNKTLDWHSVWGGILVHTAHSMYVAIQMCGGVGILDVPIVASVSLSCLQETESFPWVVRSEEATM